MKALTWLVVAVSGICLALPCAAQKSGDEAEPKLVVLKEDARINSGKMLIWQGTATTAGTRFLVQDLRTTQPVFVAVVAPDSDTELRLQIFKDHAWDRPMQEHSTAPNGRATAKFRTNEEFGFAVVASGGESSEFQALVWAGPSVDLPPTIPAVVPFSEYEAPEEASENPASGNTLPVALIAALLIIAALFAVLRYRRQS